jgi:hypothetical protein
MCLVVDRRAGDRVEPERAGTAFWLVARGRAPDRCERLLRGVLCAAAVAEPSQRQAEHRSCEALVDRFERRAVTIADPPD